MSKRLVRALSFHSTYRCENSGICCSSGWEVAVEEPVEGNLRRRLPSAASALPNGPDGFVPALNPPTGCRSVFRLHERSGACWFRDPDAGRCALHREFGEEALPSACRQFPRVCVLEPGTVSVSLSHYCPTAAALLFREESGFGIVQDPPAFPASWPFEGLDATEAYPPLLGPGVLLGLDGLRAFEEGAIAVLAEGGLWRALRRIIDAAETSRRWTPEGGPLREVIHTAFVRSSGEAEPSLSDPRAILRASAATGSTSLPELPEFNGHAPRITAPVDLAIRRYIAARLVAAWIMFLADDLATVTRYLRLCVDAVFLFESAQPASAGPQKRWLEAIRQADLWILHHCDPDLLARNLG